MPTEAIWVEAILMISGALFGIGAFLGCIALAIYYFLDRNDD
jgi:hypothetical protein